MPNGFPNVDPDAWRQADVTQCFTLVVECEGGVVTARDFEHLSDAMHAHRIAISDMRVHKSYVTAYQHGKKPEICATWPSEEPSDDDQ